MVFGLIGVEMGLFNWSLFQALPLRVFGIMANDTLLAIPFFTFMGIVLERSGMAEDLLDTIGQLFGTVRGGLAFAALQQLFDAMTMRVHLHELLQRRPLRPTRQRIPRARS